MRVSAGCEAILNKNLLTIGDLTKKEIDDLFALALDLKKRTKRGIQDRPLAGKILGMIFDKASTRTRVSFEGAIIQLGGTAIFLSPEDTQMNRDEPIRDTARVLSRYIDALAIRTFSQDYLEQFAEHATIPVINALTDLYHPCQVLSDILTVIEYKGGYENAKVAWVGDGNNVAHSWINAAAVLGFNLSLACPEGYYPDQDLLDRAVREGIGTITVTTDPVEAVEGADVVYTDVWASMGQEEEAEKRKAIFAPYQVNDELLHAAKEDVMVMHCLPAHREEEITDAVMEGPRSAVWDQTENKLHMHKAILQKLVG